MISLPHSTWIGGNFKDPFLLKLFFRKKNPRPPLGVSFLYLPNTKREEKNCGDLTPNSKVLKSPNFPAFPETAQLRFDLLRPEKYLN